MRHIILFESFDENRTKYMIDLELKRRAVDRKKAERQEIDDIDLSDDEIKEILLAVKSKKYDFMGNLNKLQKLQILRLVKAPSAINTASSFSVPFYITAKGEKLISKNAE